MYKEIENYITSVIAETNAEKLEKTLGILMEIYSIGLVGNDDYNLWLKKIQQRLVDLDMGLNGIDIGIRARTGLLSAGIATIPELKHLLMGEDEKGRSFFKIRGIGDKTQYEIVHAVIKKRILYCEDLGKKCSNKSERERWRHMRQEVNGKERKEESKIYSGEGEI